MNGGSILAKGGPSGANQHDQSGHLIRDTEEAETALNEAWDIYYTIFRRINKLLPQLRKLELSQCSPASNLLVATKATAMPLKLKLLQRREVARIWPRLLSLKLIPSLAP